MRNPLPLSQLEPSTEARLFRVLFPAAIACATGLLLAGCKAGPNYQAPKTEVGAAYANGAQTNITTGPIAITWWRGFNDPKLDGLVERALSANHDLRIATARVRQARALRGFAVAGAFPVVTANAGYNKSLTSMDATPIPLTKEQRELELYNAGFDATWELDLFGHVRRSVEAASAELSASEANRQDVMISLIAEIARNYCELRGAQLEMDVARRNVEVQQETLEVTEAKLRVGRGTDLDLARAKAQLTSTLAVIPPLEATIKHAIYRLGVLTGSQPTALEADLAQPAPIPALPALVNIGNPADLLRRRPDIRAAERSLASATALIGVATADLFPRVFFNGSIGVAANTVPRMTEGSAKNYSFGPQITWAALDLGHVSARIRAANAQADAELANYEKTVLTALEETENALVDFGREQARRDYLRESVRSAVEATKLATQRYEGGVADFLQVLDAQRTQLVVEDQLAQSEARTATSLVAIYKALGGGWEIERDTTATGAGNASPAPAK
jgi:multidrug efflux system outer membrane protein